MLFVISISLITNVSQRHIPIAHLVDSDVHHLVDNNHFEMLIIFLCHVREVPCDVRCLVLPTSECRCYGLRLIIVILIDERSIAP